MSVLPTRTITRTISDLPSVLSDQKYSVTVVYEADTGKIVQVNSNPAEPIRYSPIISEHDNSYYRVIVQQTGDLYTVHTGDTSKRILMEPDLPVEVKVKLTMIKAYKEELQPEAQLGTVVFNTWSPMDLYLNTYSSDFSDIGWRCKGLHDTYCVVTTVETLSLLRGEPLWEDQ